MHGKYGITTGNAIEHSPAALRKVDSAQKEKRRSRASSVARRYELSVKVFCHVEKTLQPEATRKVGLTFRCPSAALLPCAQMFSWSSVLILRHSPITGVICMPHASANCRIQLLSTRIKTPIIEAGILWRPCALQDSVLYPWGSAPDPTLSPV